MKKNKNSLEQEIPKMEIDRKYSNKNIHIPENSNGIQKDTEKTKKEIDKIKNFVVKNFSCTMAIGILPPQGIKHFIDEEEVPKETEKFLHLYIIIPEEKFKEIPKIKKKVVEQIE